MWLKSENKEVNGVHLDPLIAAADAHYRASLLIQDLDQSPSNSCADLTIHAGHRSRRFHRIIQFIPANAI